MRNKSYLIVLFLLNLLSGFCMEGEISFVHLDIKEGLSQNTVLDITQDTKGNMWFATLNGVNKYNGYDFTIYRHQEEDTGSIADNTIRTVKADEKGGVWIGTDNGLSYYNSQSDSFHNFQYAVHGEMTSVKDIEIIDSELLLTNTSAGLLLFSIRDSAFSRNLLNANIFKLSATAIQRYKDQLYIGTTEGLWRYSLSQHTLDKIISSPLEKTEILAILQESEDRLWVGTEGNGLYLINPQNQDIKHYSAQNPNELSSNFIRSLALDEQGRLWIGTFNSLDIYDKQKNTFTVYTSNRIQNRSLSQSSIRSIFMDSQKGMWLGTYFGGVNYYHPLRERFQHMHFTSDRNSLNDNVIGCIVEDNSGDLWIGTNSGGVNYYNLQKQEFSYYTTEQGLGSNDVKAIYVDELHDKVYIGTHAGGLNVLNRKSGKVAYISPSPATQSCKNIYAILPHNDGKHLWLGTLSSLILFDKTRHSFTAATQADGTPIEITRIRTLLDDKRGRLWVGGEDGIAVYKSTDSGLVADNILQKNPSLKGMYTYCICETSDGTIWIGTRNGLYSFKSETDEWQHYTTKDGMLSRTVYGIIEDNYHRLWVSTDNGLSYLYPEVTKFRTFTDADGIQSNQFTPYAYCKSSNGTIYFGGINGITSFNPDNLQDNPYTPNPKIANLKVAGIDVFPHDKTGILKKHISETSQMTLEHDKASFSLELVVSNYIAGKHNTFAYKLDGYDKEWYYINDNQRWVSYSNLPPAEYKFLVKAANNDGKWCDQPTILQVTILPAWYQTWWANLLFILMVTGVILLIFRIQWERMDKKKQKELQEMKMRFFINISHELRTPLTLILAPLQELLDKSTDKWIRNQLEYIQRNTNRLLHLVNQLMDYRRAEQGVFELKVKLTNVHAIVKKNFLYYDFLAQKKNISYNLYSEVEDQEVYCDSSYIELILNNLLSNAFKYTGDKQSITVTLKKEADFLLLQVKDTGTGIPVNKQAKIFERFYQIDNEHMGSGIGLSLVQKLVELHHGRIELESSVGKGSCFSVYLPTSESAYTPTELSDKNSDKEAPVYSTNMQDMYTIDTESPRIEPITQAGNKKETILIVEDNEEIRHYLSNELSKLFITQEAVNGEEALEFLKENETDLIITDVMMPVMDGIQLCKLIKQNLRTCHIPVIILSAKAKIKDQMEGMQVGADDYIPKPFTLSLVVAKIRNILRTRYRFIEHYSKSLKIEPEKIAMNPLDEEFLKKAMQIVEKNLDKTEFSTDDFAKEMGMSRSSLHMKMKGVTGESTTEFIRKVRFSQACKLLKEGRYNVTEISTMVGFNTPSYFATSFKKYMGCLPSEYGKNGGIQQN